MKIAWFINFIITVASHMQMSFPSPRGDPTSAIPGPKDYDLKSPLSTFSACKGKPPGNVAATFHAGEVIPVQFKGSARHGGGFCQFALSYDGDKSFIVIESIQGACPNQAFTWPVKLPENLPSCERCTFAWTWINAVGNREYYMNCADVKIVGSQVAKGISGHELVVANLPGFPTIKPNVQDGGPENSKISHYNVEAI